MKTKIEAVLNSLPEVIWDRWAGQKDGYMTAFGWIKRRDGQRDFVVVFLDSGKPWAVVTSSAACSEQFSRTLGLTSGEHRPCKRVADEFVVNCVVP